MVGERRERAEKNLLRFFLPTQGFGPYALNPGPQTIHPRPSPSPTHTSTPETNDDTHPLMRHAAPVSVPVTLTLYAVLPLILDTTAYAVTVPLPPTAWMTRS